MTDFYKDKKIVVTGGAGFVGSHLVELLLEAGANVFVVDNFKRGKNRVGNAQYIQGDASDISVCVDFFNDAFAVFNLAAHVAGVIYNATHHAEMFDKNLAVQMTPVRAAKICNVSHFLQTSTVCVYSPMCNSPAVEMHGKEGHPVYANEGYSWAKRMGERFTEWSDLKHAVIVRPSNIYGPRDYFDERSHVIPAIIKKCLNDDVLELHGDGNEQREFIYVDDVARGMMCALERGKNNTAYNIGTNKKTCISIFKLAQMIQKLTNTEHKDIEFVGGRPGDRCRYSLAERLNLLGWHPMYDLEDGLQNTIEWYNEAKI